MITPALATISSALAVGVTTFSDQWPRPTGFPENRYEVGGGYYPDGSARSYSYLHGNDFERAYRGKWRPRSGFVYRTDAVQGTGLFGDANQRTYLDAGVFQFTQFNWQDLTQNDTTRWIRATTTTTYSPHGDAMEERDALGIRSAAWYDSDLNLPILVAANAGYQTVRFNSFERETAQTSSVVAHAGSRSLKIDPSGTGVGLSAVGIDAQCLTNGMLLEFWARRRYFNLLDNQMPVTVKLTAAGRTVGTYTAYNKIAQTGDWVLYSVETHDFIPVDTADGGMLDVDFTNTFVKDTVWIDDIRIQPFDAEMQCFVYDPSMKRLIAAFDDQHFGTYYQYNGEGQLVRKIQETERGMKTVEEYQYHIPLADRLPEYSGKAGRRPVGNSGFSSRPQSLSVDPRADGGEPSGASAGGKFSLLDVTIDRNGVSVEGPRLDSAFDIPELPSFSAIDSSLANGTNLNLPESWNVEKYGVLKEIDSLNRAADRIRKDAEGLNASSEKKQAEDRLAAIDARKKELLSNIDLSDEEAQHLIEQIRSKVEGKDIHIEK